MPISPPPAHLAAAALAIFLSACAPDPIPTTPFLPPTADIPLAADRGEDARTPIAERQYLRIRLRDDAPVAYRDSLLAHGAAFVSQFHGTHPVGVSASREAFKHISRLPWLTVVEVDSTTRLTLTDQTVPWGVQAVGAPFVHSTYGFTGSGVKIAVIDDRMACSHPDLTVWGAYDFVSFPPSPTAYCGVDGTHGTRVAGVIAAKDNAIDVVGIAPGAKIYSLRTCNLAGDCDRSATIDALGWAKLNGMQIASLSIADCGSHSDGGFGQAVLDLCNMGVPVVVGHGANTACSPGDPVSTFAANSMTIAVAGHTADGAYIPVYQYGSAVDFSAPTVVQTLSSVGGTTTISQVSGAVPHVSGALALLIEAGFSGVLSMKTRLIETAQDAGAPGKDDFYGYGVLRVSAAATPRPSVTNLTWCTSGGITSPGNCSMTATTINGAGLYTLVRFVAYYSNAPNDSTVYDWGSKTRSITVPAGDYTLTIKTQARDAYGRTSTLVNTWEIPVCTNGSSLVLPGTSPETSAAANCGGGGEEN
ncbi:MAG TPA: S8 family serine peptidase [Gemmatimonadales bacterium]|nr:S8 family serine peptidase [Gemmatimonadales bacterium]